jgi:SAM-dependent methyltransferase
MVQVWTAYKQRPIVRDLHPADHMFNTAARGWDDYLAVGESAASVITYVLSAGPSGDVRRFMDFGCGHGRVARHLRAMFPDTEAVFVDIDPTGAEFCATTFNGTPITSEEDFSKLKLPANMDLIWLGSVFTHLDYGRMNTLFDLLASCLSRHGVLVGTFRGQTMYDTMKELAAKDPNTQRKWGSLLQQYEANGFGFAPYDMAENAEWGLFLSGINSVAGLGRRRGDMKMIAFREAGWAGAHDVAAWARMAVS